MEKKTDHEMQEGGYRDYTARNIGRLSPNNGESNGKANGKLQGSWAWVYRECIGIVK